MKFNKYGDTGQFKDVVRTITSRADYKGRDADGDPIYESSTKPTLTFTGTVKLHGTNAGIRWCPQIGLQAQSRSNTLNPSEGGHFGFNEFVNYTHSVYFENLMSTYWDTVTASNPAIATTQYITLYGEWAGEGVQKGVGISQVPKAFYIFGLRVADTMNDETTWIDISDICFPPNDSVFSIYSFPTFKIEIDFNKPGLSQNKLIELTEAVEAECPVTLAHGIENGIGEGIVWTTFWEGERYIFKVKGEKHSTSKVKKLASADPEVLNSIYEFVSYACTSNRVLQAIHETGATEKRNTPDVLRWVANDIIKEEIDVLRANGLEWTQVAKEVSNQARTIFFKEMDKVES